MARREGRKGRRAASGSAATIAAGADPSQLLPMALHHHEQGDLARARALYEQVIESTPEHADALQLFGILCHQQGDAAAAESLIRRALAIDATVAPYHDNLGTVLERAGRVDEALTAYEAADALEPGDPDRSFNMGLALERLGRLEEAERRLREALELRAEDRECRFALANVLKRRGAVEQARTAYRLVLKVDPDHAGALVNLGNVLQDQGDEVEALALYQRALAKNPRNAAAHHNQARLLRRQGQLVDARVGFERALRHDPGLVDARLGLAQCLEEQGELDAALAAYRELCAVDEVAADARAALVRVARVVAPRSHDAVLERALIDAVDGQRTPASTLARVLGWQLWAKVFGDDGEPGDDREALGRAREVAADRLFELALGRAVNVVPALERWLVRVRRALLERDDVYTAQDRALLCTLALQCTANDHVFLAGEQEQAAVEALRGRIESWLGGGEPVAAEALACAACYGLLADLEGAGDLPARVGGDDAWLAPVIEASLARVLEERRLSLRLRELEPVDDAVSRLVREQYEEHPYPRWSELPPVASVGEPARERLEQAQREGRTLDILVAGCGTGQEPLAIASRFPAHRIVALDLSRASLAYAWRMAQQLGVDGVEFVHGDLQHAAALGRRFDLVTATGVLHHMADPVAGWRALRECLAPDGLMRIGLYSAAARGAVNDARRRIGELGLGRDAQAVRTLRARILDGREPELESLLDSEDFFATSTCRDLLFHPVEHQFDLAGIGAILDELALGFRGFELPHPLLLTRFRRGGFGEPSDLTAWARFEQANPDAFEAMYQFWCAAVGSGDGGAGDA